MSTTTSPEPSPQVVRRASTAGFLGTMIEAYDFIVFTYILVYIAPLFFPGESTTASILSGLAVLGTGLLARPVGGIIFGRMGDRRGRRVTLIVTITGMGLATFLIGLLPTFEQVGILAPILLCLLRLGQGLAAGGEIMGSATFVSEHATKKNHGLLSAMTPMGFALGTALAPGVVALVTLFASEETMAAGGWRIPLLLSLPLTLIVLYLRTRLEESPEFRRLADLQELRKAPVRAVFQGYAGTLFKVVAISASVLLTGYVVAAYMPLFLQQQVGLAPGTTAGIATFASFFGIILGFSAGFLIDRLGRKATMILILTIVGLLMFPAMYLMKLTGGNFVVTALLQMLLAGLAGAAAVPAYATFTALFPVSVRYTGAAMGFGLGSAIGGGFGPYLAGLLTEVTGNIYAPAGLVAAAALLGIAVISTMPSRTILEDELVVRAEQREGATGAPESTVAP